MNKNIVHIIHFILVITIQVALLNHITIKSSVSIFGIPAFIPLLYPALILMLPVNVNYFVMMTYAFVVGFILDYFGNTPGMHAAPMVLLAFMRPRLLNLFFQKDIKQIGSIIPSMYRIDFGPFLVYVSLGILIHHLFFFILQIWSFSNLHIVLFKLLLSGVVSILLILIGQLIFYRRQVRKI